MYLSPLHAAPQGIGNGFPLGAVVTTPEIAQVLARKLVIYYAVPPP